MSDSSTPEARSYLLPPHIAAQWHALTVKRRDHLAELYQSGRWRRYFDEPDFLALMREAVQSVEDWAAIAKMMEDSSAGTAAPQSDSAPAAGSAAEAAAPQTDTVRNDIDAALDAIIAQVRAA